MENPRSISEMINQTKRIEENNSNNMEHLTSMEILLTSNDYARSKDENLSKTFYKLQEKVEDINTLTKKLLSDLEDKTDDHESIH
ncbi:hypothetical protein FYJ27_01915 [Anaerosalibacter bizertensis]|uniref:Uncharacterized protein n=1 Tax=Anaerosalibacter bizertensis TaxID=932217 RepID=A0A844FES3_9FIRM|nr:hypothetical protein [Anaerosalibacter bizertensis]MBU5292879.1 hypothetical protein [Anaerosalibacter bizertensis]MSS42494.1 hypothetical protein [Anaerosalibacter bizertensis]